MASLTKTLKKDEDYQKKNTAFENFSKTSNPQYYGSTTQLNNQNAINLANDAIKNREKFSYDFNADALYQQYKDNYMRQGKMAMADTMAQAQALSGGFGNSYAATAGNLAYQGYLGQVNNVIPELQQLAYGRYQQEGSDLQDAYNRALQQNELDRQAFSDRNNYWLQQYNLLKQERDDAYNRALTAWQASQSGGSSGGNNNGSPGNPDTSTKKVVLSDSALEWIDNYFNKALKHTGKTSSAITLLRQELNRLGTQGRELDRLGMQGKITKTLVDEIIDDYRNRYYNK